MESATQSIHAAKAQSNSVKLRTLADLYQILHQDWLNFWMVVLATTIVLLFIIDVLLLLMG